MLEVSPCKGVIRFSKRGKLNPRYIGPFKILAKVGTVAYRLELPKKLSRVHKLFEVMGTVEVNSAWKQCSIAVSSKVKGGSRWLWYLGGSSWGGSAGALGVNGRYWVRARLDLKNLPVPPGRTDLRGFINVVVFWK
ncbi:hypothetical protein Tco_0500152 [Tanacetum coccineum]